MDTPIPSYSTLFLLSCYPSLTTSDQQSLCSDREMDKESLEERISPRVETQEERMSARSRRLFQQKKEFFESVHQPREYPPPIFVDPPETPPGHSSRMSRSDLPLSMDTKRCSSMPARLTPPPKPPRTFAHDVYMAEKAAQERERLEREKLEMEMAQLMAEDREDSDQEKEGEEDEEENITGGWNASALISRKVPQFQYERLSSDSSPPSSTPFVRRYKRPDSLDTDKIVELKPVNGNYCTILEKGAITPLTPCESPLMLKSAQTEDDGPYFEFKLRRTMGQRKKKKEDKEEEEDEGEEERVRLKHRTALIRQHTLEQIKKQNEELATATKQMLFDTAVIVSIEKISNKHGKVEQSPHITFLYGAVPEEKNLAIAQVIYPDASHVTMMSRGKGPDPTDSTFFAALTNEIGIRTYAYCIKFEPASSETEPYFYPSVFALITRIRDPPFYFELARRGLQHIGDVHRLKRFLKSIHHKDHPNKGGGMLIVEERDENDEFVVRSEICSFGCEPRWRKGWSVNDLVRQLTPEWTTCMIAAVLGEQRVLITGSTVHEVTRAVQAVDALLRPLEWPFCFVPCIPDTLVEMCDNPSPYLMGILRHNLPKIQHLVIEDYLDEEYCKNQVDFVLFDITRGLINPIPMTFKKNKHFEDPDKHHFISLDEKERETLMRTKNCYAYCKRVGMPRKVAKALVQLLYKGLEKDKLGIAEVESSTESMLQWYASIFGHYKKTGATTAWDKSIKTLLVEKQSNPERKEYLEYLVETAMFDMWISRRVLTSYNVAKMVGQSILHSVQFMQNMLACWELTMIRDEAPPGFLKLWQIKVGDRVVPENELEMIDLSFDQICQAENFKRKQPLKHAMGKLFGGQGSSRSL